ncbi:ATP-dependent nuclease [Anoxybacillus flavithermus]|uniref:ATP-dependent nuclease n=1 Tax=Anoxybacillus flavithermus TaxID=33934 RepID=UPI00031C892D|nr:AAA family ATPase [Anoxybacillus flavithermus]
MRSPYISRVKIKNFRNFRDIDISLSHKQVIIGENNVGKTNFLRAIQLILDPTLSDEDRYLTESDFFDGLENPMENGEDIEIIIEIRGYEHNKNILSVLSDATISDDPPTLRLTYRYYPIEKEDGTKDYEYIIFQGINPDNLFKHSHRKYLNMRVINAIRDVESELRNSRRSPINQLLKQYEIDKTELKEIAEKLKQRSDEVLTLDEIKDLTQKINERFKKVIGVQPDSLVSLETIDIDPNRILNTLKLMMGDKKRPTSETSLGLNNLLYIALILLLLEDRTIPTFLKKEKFEELLQKSGSNILTSSYEKNDNDNYFLKGDLSKNELKQLYSFMDMHNPINEGFTILAIEEPEAHLHPTLQRIIYRDVMVGNSSVLMTTHSPHITSVAPINSIVHMRWTNNGTQVHTTSNLSLTPTEKRDLERYLDVKRGEIYFGKGVILVEGIAEEYLIPRFAELLDKPLDQKGIVVCNINSTNFAPYVKFLDALGIPYVVITDGDYYILEEDGKTKIFHVLYDQSHENYGFLGHEIISTLLTDLQKVKRSQIPTDFQKQEDLFNKHGFFVGYYTLEVDIMVQSAENEEAKELIYQVFSELTIGGEKQKSNFKNELNAEKYFDCLRKIESSKNGIGKGRFSQRFSNMCIKDHIPVYIENAINQIYKKVDEV